MMGSVEGGFGESVQKKFGVYLVRVGGESRMVGHSTVQAHLRGNLNLAGEAVATLDALGP